MCKTQTFRYSATHETILSVTTTGHITATEITINEKINHAINAALQPLLIMTKDEVELNFDKIREMAPSFIITEQLNITINNLQKTFQKCILPEEDLKKLYWNYAYYIEKTGATGIEQITRMVDLELLQRKIINMIINEQQNFTNKYELHIYYAFTKLIQLLKIVMGDNLSLIRQKNFHEKKAEELTVKLAEFRENIILEGDKQMKSILGSMTVKTYDPPNITYLVARLDIVKAWFYYLHRPENIYTTSKQYLDTFQYLKIKYGNKSDAYEELISLLQIEFPLPPNHNIPPNPY